MYYSCLVEGSCWWVYATTLSVEDDAYEFFLYVFFKDEFLLRMGGGFLSINESVSVIKGCINN